MKLSIVRVGWTITRTSVLPLRNERPVERSEGMKGLIREVALALGCTLGAAAIGCSTLSTCGDGCGGGGTGLGGSGAGAPPVCSNKGLYDRCYPERYNSLAR